MRAIGGALLVASCLCGIAGVIFLARVAKPLLRRYWVAEVTDPPSVTAVRKVDIRGAAVSMTLALVALVLAMSLIALRRRPGECSGMSPDASGGFNWRLQRSLERRGAWKLYLLSSIAALALAVASTVALIWALDNRRDIIVLVIIGYVGAMWVALIFFLGGIVGTYQALKQHRNASSG